jgi:hypothetical protein
MNVYGIFLTPEEIQERNNKLFIYYKAIVSTYKLNPEKDWHFEEGNKILKRIGSSSLNEVQRTILISELSGFEEE